MSLAARPLATVSANAVPRRARLSAEAAASEIGVQRSRENSRVNPGSNCAPQKPAHEPIAALVDMKQWNPSWVCPRIAQQIDPFVERLIGTIRRECRDDTLFWTAADLETKLLDFQSLLQRSSHIRGAGRAHVGVAHGYGRRPRECQFVSMAAALSWGIRPRGRRDACRTAAGSGQITGTRILSGCLQHNWEFASHRALATGSIGAV